MNDKKLYRTLSLIFLGIIMIPALQMVTGLVHERKLYGAYYEQEWPEFKVKEWLDFTYQPKLHRYLEQNYGFRASFIRLYNQIDFSLYKKNNASGVVYGKEGYLYEEWFISAHYGRDYIGDEAITTMTRRLTRLRKTLKEQGTELIIALTPSKADYWPEYIPDRYHQEKSLTNYEAMARSFQENGLPTIDYNRLFMEQKEQARYDLFPKTGTHWSHYGSRVALDTLVDFVSQVMQRPMPDVELQPTVPTRKLLSPDDDMERLMNLAFKTKHVETGYPEILYKGADTLDLPRVIVIADSFFWNMFNLALNGKAFKEVKYWYYFNSVYPDSFKTPTTVNDLNLKEEVLNADLILIMGCPATINNLGWGFIERGFRELVLGLSEEGWNSEYQKKIVEVEKQIRKNPEWFKHVSEKADKLSIPLDTMIQRDARYMVDEMIKRGEF
ncbi:MAG: hypothetical protein PHV14_05035 [Bacteroidales bacterium]|nr:hypothetical protein [Bacteroidales bacterium]MDD2812348.1 hypothetical protein [Bacteroidales bacterium]MDD3811628.1 hypothetical protein [Bacteroidales bacterium]MDD3870856.1 hypothetical protein [Bacteroidales bacterium]MDD4813441.1 hypothetical protein [Bacteroidales bacterium]